MQGAQIPQSDGFAYIDDFESADTVSLISVGGENVVDSVLDLQGRAYSGPASVGAWNTNIQSFEGGHSLKLTKNVSSNQWCGGKGRRAVHHNKSCHVDR